MSNGIRFAGEFKRDALAQVAVRGYAVSKIAERLGISIKTPQTWKAQFVKPPCARLQVLDKAFVKIKGEIHLLWRAADHKGEVLRSFLMMRGDRKPALKFLRKPTKHHAGPHILVIEKLRSCGAVVKHDGNVIDRKLAAGSIV